ncbi:MAG: peptidoglycan DD-metalloendopeptidase family protein [Patescibacteria group bacterium]
MLGSFLLAGSSSARASELDDLQNKIASQKVELQKLDQQIRDLSGKITTTKQQSTSLKNQIAQLELTRKKLAGDITVTQKKISIANLAIKKLTVEIGQTLDEMDRRRMALANSMRRLNNEDSVGLLELALSSGSLSGFIDQTESFYQLGGELDKSINGLKTQKISLDGQQKKKVQEKNTLTSLQSQLSDQKQIADQNKQQKNTLLTQTKSQEATYTKMLNDSLVKKQEVETEISNIESKIDIIINPKSLPKTGTGILSWPLAKIIITQYFGNTAFSTKNPQVYNGKGHNGIDLGTPVGTPIKTAGDGTVLGTGNTDLACAGASYGKWVLIRHTNGLSTLYAHLSLIKVESGQSVSTGDIIAYSGNTGYSTGPHLHFTVYASEAVSISSLKSKVRGCGTYILPVSSYSGYLNPLSYLPSN